ncbi:hypothetical protein FRC07_004935 [Ceratobasidium sp. 392]|nr:hypothetical protein FRC07_004935 [Ceratobasidium sp. 392]
MSPTQTKEVEYYRAAPSAPGSHSIDLERVHPRVKPALTRSPSDPPSVAPLAINKRTKAPPAAIIVPATTARTEVARPPRSPARQVGYFDDEQPTVQSAPKPNRGPAPGPPPQGPLPPLPDQQAPFTGVDPLVLRAVTAQEQRKTKRQSKTPDDKDIAALERSMRRLSRVSLATGESAGPTSPILAGRDSPFGRERAEKLLKRISRQSEGVRLPSDYGRVGISGFSVPSSAPVSPGLRGVPAPLRPFSSETEPSELAYLVDRPVPALSVPMRRNVEQAHSAPGLYTPAEPTNALGLGLTLAPSDSLPSLPSDATLPTLSSEATIRPTLESRPSRLGSLSSASSTAASTHSSLTFETASTSSLLTPISPPTNSTSLPNRSPMSPPRPLKMKATIKRAGSPDIPSILAQFRDKETLAVAVAAPEVQAVPATRLRPGARPRLHSDLAPLDIPPPVPSKDIIVGSQPEGTQSTRSSTDSRVAVDSHHENVLDVPPTRVSIDSQTTPRLANRSAAPTPTPKTAATPSNRPTSPDISYILRTTPRPTRRSSAQSLVPSLAPSRRPSAMGLAGPAPPSSFKGMPGLIAGPSSSRRGSEISSRRSSSSNVTACSQGLDVEGAGPELFFGEQYDSDDSDSDLDLSTPLPHMMLRAGLLSPRSTIITELMELPLPGAAARRDGADEFGKLDFPMPPTATSWRPQPSPALKRFPSNTMMRSSSAPAPVPPPTPASTLRARTPSSSASSSSVRTPARSRMPTPSKINLRAPSATRLSAPEALREANSLVPDGSRRLSGA